jgi:hypothetical protein
MRNPKPRVIVAFGAALLAIPALAAAPAQATVVEHGSWSGASDPNVPQIEDCGTFQLRHDWTARGTFVAREVRGSAFPYALDTFHADSVFTNTANGHWFTVSQDFINKDTQITSLGGDLYRFEWMAPGGVFRLRDMAGRLVTLDAGNFYVSQVVDVVNDVAGPLELGVVHGPHPNIEKYMCEIAEEYNLT